MNDAKKKKTSRVIYKKRVNFVAKARAFYAAVRSKTAFLH